MLPLTFPLFPAIFLGAAINVSYDELKLQILGVSDELSESLCESLLKQLPEAEMITAVRELKDQYHELVPAEQFICTVGLLLYLIRRKISKNG